MTFPATIPSKQPVIPQIIALSNLNKIAAISEKKSKRCILLEFTARKLPKEAAENMRSCSIHSVQPYALMLAPTYVFLRANQKFVAIKEPLDFFTPDELKKVALMASFFFPEFVDQALPFRDRAKTVRSILQWKSGATTTQPLPPSSFEVSDSILKLVAPLWSQDLTIEPFFVVIFISELCDLIPETDLLSVRDQSLELFDKALTVSAWATFLAIHLGYCELSFLTAFRTEVFQEVAGITALNFRTTDLDEIKVIARDTSISTDADFFSIDTFTGRDERAASKILARLKRIQERLIVRSAAVVSIHGQKGFVNE